MAPPSAIAALLAGAITLLAGYAILQGVAPAGATGRVTYNLDPEFGSSQNDLVWDPNFLPGFNGTPEVHLGWNAPPGGPGAIDYLVGPWANGSVAPYPHFAVGPQAFNFEEVPRTQVYRSPLWGDYHSVSQGFRSCAVNQGNLTVNASQAIHPVYVGMPETGVDWTVRFTLNWTPPETLAGVPTSAYVAVTTTTTLPALPGAAGARLVYSQILLWANGPTSLGPSFPTDAPSEGAIGTDRFAVPYLSPTTSVRTYDLDLSGYLSQTLADSRTDGSGALLSYVYLDVGGYNVHLRLDVRSLFVEGPNWLCAPSALLGPAGAPLPGFAPVARTAVTSGAYDFERRR